MKILLEKFMRVKKVEYLDNYRLKIVFSNNISKIVDLKYYIQEKGLFAPLKDMAYFKNVSVDKDGITICWPNGADFSPEILYEIGK